MHGSDLKKIHPSDPMHDTYNSAIDSEIKSAKEILRIRYDELKLQLPPIKSIAPKQLEIRLQQYEIVGGLFYFRSSKHGMLLCVPNIYNASGHHLRQLIFDEMHKVPHRGHRGVTATKSAMRVRFHWSTIYDERCSANAQSLSWMPSVKD